MPVGRVYGVLRERGVLRSATEARRLDEARRRAVKVPANAPQAKWREAAPAGGAGRVRTISAELAAAVVERYAAGESGEKIAQDLGLGHGWVYKLLRERTLSDGSSVLRTQSEASALREERRRVPGSLG